MTKRLECACGAVIVGETGEQLLGAVERHIERRHRDLLCGDEVARLTSETAERRLCRLGADNRSVPPRL